MITRSVPSIQLYLQRTGVPDQTFCASRAQLLMSILSLNTSREDIVYGPFAHQGPVLRVSL